MARYNNTERLGVLAVESIVVKSLNWIFREQPISDMGIDAHIEYVIDGTPTGRLVAVQIKTGSSHFTDKKDTLIYYGKNVHLEYWCGHSLPVLLIAHLPSSDETFWTLIEKSSITLTKSAWKIEIHKSNVFCAKASERLSAIFETQNSKQDPYSLKKISWTTYQKIDISGFVPPSASHINIQYRMWSEKNSIPLLIRFSSEDGGGVMQEHSGPSGVIDLMLTNQNFIYISTSHPEANFQLSVLGWTDNF